MKKLSLVLVASLLSSFTLISTSKAADFKWKGRYRWEGVSVRNSNLANGGASKAYMLHHLILSPEIIPADGFIITTRFDIMNNTGALYRNSQMGQFLGQGPNPTGAGGTTDASNSNVLSQSQGSDMLLINELYLTWRQEFAALEVGRKAIHFGLGMTHNSGAGEFDHWLDTKDIVGYKMIFGTLFLMPMIGKVNEGQLQTEDDVNDYMLHFQYDNKESKLSMGAFYEARIGTNGGGNDAPGNMAGSGSVTEGWESKQLNIFVAREFEESAIGFEAG
ncbi:MAG TPA: hypothetical protein VFV50_12325, partial [Bdellovibrionales bacterium]|nr:hypothetical protein [Bdellovibrionales bacterium]